MKFFGPEGRSEDLPYDLDEPYGWGGAGRQQGETLYVVHTFTSEDPGSDMRCH